MLLDVGTTVGLVALVVALIPLPDILIGWLCIGIPELRSPATRMVELKRSLEHTAKLLAANDTLIPRPLLEKWEWKTLQREAHELEVLVKRGRWGPYSVAHLLFHTRDVAQVNRRYNSVSKLLRDFDKNAFTHVANRSGLLDTAATDSQDADDGYDNDAPPRREAYDALPTGDEDPHSAPPRGRREETGEETPYVSRPSPSRSYESLTPTVEDGGGADQLRKMEEGDQDA